MKEPMVITMAREYASGGSEIAQAVADKLGIPLYNKELITLAAKKSGLTEEAIAASENQRSGSLIYSLYMMGNTMPLADQVYILQSNVIKELASQGPCVILGRCGDYVLRERPNVLRTFVYAPVADRVGRAKSPPRCQGDARPHVGKPTGQARPCPCQLLQLLYREPLGRSQKL